MRGRSSEALWWSLFTAGGVIAALFIPVMIGITGIAGGVGWDAAVTALSHGDEGIGDLLRHALVRAAIGLIIGLSAVHAAHRIRHLLIDIHVPVNHRALAVTSYAGAAAVTAVGAVVLVLV